ncbi:snustorr snarlik [Temnothorax americanus]|uniref:snustorr snarlik n=1 Tax=Temnothorax americanus TaxID=1964332 RepID=UPI0040675A4D
MMIVKRAISQLLLFIVFCDHVRSLIIPEELPTILSLIYSNIPVIKKGTDSRLGVGFRLGEHADFQILVELGPQTETDPIGTSNDAKRRRDAAFNAAMKGELGPLAQAVAKYQMERKIQKEIDKLKVMEEKLKKIQIEDTKDQDTVSSNWLTKWRKEMSQLSKDNMPLSSAQNGDDKIIQQRIGKPPVKSIV